MVNRWTNLCIARSCSARKYPANCPNTTDLSTKRQSLILSSAASRHGFCAPKRPIYPAFTMLSHEEKPRGCFRDSPLSGRCTIQRDCKLPPIKAYQKALPPDTVQYIGIAADEPKRLARLKSNQISLLDKYHVAEPEARSMCAAEEPLSPLYDFTKRGGCWFCPNASISELRHLYRYHPELWQLLLELQDVPNKPTERFSWRRTFREIDERFRQEGEQLSFYEER